MNLDPVAEIKAKLSIEELVSRYVSLKRTGRTLKGLCPFHPEKTPSFVVSTDRQTAYCFGCHKGGDVFAFVQEIEGMNFKEALVFLADRAGVSLESHAAFSKSSGPSKDVRERFFEINRETAAFYAQALFSSAEGQKALHYLEQRGILPQTLQDFKVGFAPDSYEATQHHLFQKNYSKADLLELGLVVSKDTSGDHTIDRFRCHIMFPIFDLQGRIIGFGGRTLKSDDPAKYMNSPDSPLYHKSQVLYGLDRAKGAIRQHDAAIIVEGYMDLLASHQIGVTHVVASSGTALTSDQLRLLKRFTSHVSFAFDTDGAGEEALHRAIELGQSLDLTMKVVRPPEGKDPDECIRRDPELWKKAVEDGPYYLDDLLQQLGARPHLDSALGKREACLFFFPFLSHASSLERDHYFHRMALLLKADPRFLYEEFKQFQKNRTSFKRELVSPSESQGKNSVHVFSRQEYFVGLLLRFCEHVDATVLEVPGDAFEGTLKKVYNTILSQYNSSACFDSAALFRDLDEDEIRTCEVLMIFAESRNADLSQDRILSEMQQAADQIHRRYRESMAEQLMHQIRLAREAKDADLEQTLFQEYSRFFHSS